MKKRSRNVETLNQNPNTAQPAHRSPEPLTVFERAVDRGEVRLELVGDSVSGEVADDQTWRTLTKAAAAHPEFIAGITLAGDDGEEVRLRRLAR
jgi:hypothetical protein